MALVDMRNLRVILEYDGSGFHGFQRQKIEPTIQGELERVLTLLLKEPIHIYCGGRTDAGVHAVGQAISFMTASSPAFNVLQKAVNAHLRPSIVIREISEVPKDFHARYSAKSRTYQYVVRSSPLPSTLEGRFFAGIRSSLDLARMTAAAQDLLGRHDFRAFSSGESWKINTIRDIRRLEVRRGGGGQFSSRLGTFAEAEEMICFEIEADAFLRGMVRMLVGTLIQVGTGRMSPDSVRELLEKAEQGSGGPQAPACGLCLLSINY